MEMNTPWFFLYLLCLLAGTTYSEDFKPERTRLVDHFSFSANWTNFFFRGNMPAIGGKFAYDQLVQSMRNVSIAAGWKLPVDFYLVDISYLNVFDEKDLRIEEDFYTHNSSIGSFVNTVIIGTVIPPPQNSTSLTKDVVKEYIEVLSHDKLNNVMSYFRKVLVTRRDKPVVIYGHCEAGTDRTGEVSGAYYMQFLNMTFSEALAIDNHIQSRDMLIMSRNEMQWYCFYLKFVHNYSWLKCVV